MRYGCPTHAAGRRRGRLPGLQIVLRTLFPETRAAVAQHKANVWTDLSGWSPMYSRPTSVRLPQHPAPDKVLFGRLPADHPAAGWRLDAWRSGMGPGEVVKANALRFSRSMTRCTGQRPVGTAKGCRSRGPPHRRRPRARRVSETRLRTPGELQPAANTRRSTAQVEHESRAPLADARVVGWSRLFVWWFGP